MKTFATIIALTVATAIAGPAFAQTQTPATTQSECEKNPDMKWNDQTKTCIKK